MNKTPNELHASLISALSYDCVQNQRDVCFWHTASYNLGIVLNRGLTDTHRLTSVLHVMRH